MQECEATIWLCGWWDKKMFFTGEKRVIIDKECYCERIMNTEEISLYEINLMERKWNPRLYRQRI